MLRLVARGLSNTEIAGELFLGDATVKTHVSRILQKLALRDRVQAVVRRLRVGSPAAGCGCGPSTGLEELHPTALAVVVLTRGC